MELDTNLEEEIKAKLSIGKGGFLMLILNKRTLTLY